jgi:hypothetical protein
MAQLGGGRRVWWALLAAIITAGLLSRVVHTGFRLLDKYAGDALYAAMVYVLFRLTGRIARITLWTAVAMTAIEFFQLTQIPAGLFRSRHLAIRLCARLLGTEFSVRDLLAYAVGIGCIAAVDRAWLTVGARRKSRDPSTGET